MQNKERTLEKFVNAQEQIYEIALAEIKNGRKHSHWIWYIFPQLKGLGKSSNSQYYGINDLEEAKAYLSHPILGKRLREITIALLNLNRVSAIDVFGELDAIKVRSCMTLFREIAEDDLFQDIINRYFSGRGDELTLNLLKDNNITQ